MVLTETGLAKVFQRVKSFVASQLNSKASAIHTHTSSDITDLPSGITVDSALSSSSENPVQNKVVKNALDGYIPLSGTNALAGSIVPDTDNAYDFGNSSHNFKIVYAREIRHGLSSGSLALSGG